MKKQIHVAVFMKEEAYALALARGLAEQAPGWQIEVQPDLEKTRAEVVLTDLPALMQGQEPEPEPEPAETKAKAQTQGRVLLLNDYTWSLPQISKALLEAVSRRRCGRSDASFSVAGEGAEDTERAGKRQIGFFGRFGGCGITACAISAGRLLAAESGQRGLYLNLSRRDDYRFYADVSFAGVRTKKELIYRLAERLPLCVESYTATDRYGLAYLAAETGENSLYGAKADKLDTLAARLAAQGEFAFTILDLGVCPVPPQAAAGTERLLVQVSHAQDCRSRVIAETNRPDLQGELVQATGEQAEDGLLYIINHSAENGQTGEQFTIAEDPESFCVYDAGDGAPAYHIEIDQSKSFAGGIRLLTAYCNSTLFHHVAQKSGRYSGVFGT